MIQLTELQLDALKELMNIGMGRAAATLNSMIHEEIKLSVPDIDFATPEKVLQKMKVGDDKEVSYVVQTFSGHFIQTDALLVFSHKESLELVSLFLGNSSIPEELTALEQEAMNEIGNIVLNARIGSLSDLLGDEVSGSLPEFYECHAGDIFKKW